MEDIEKQKVHVLWKDTEGRNEYGEEWADVRGLLANWIYGDSGEESTEGQVYLPLGAIHQAAA